MKYLLSSLVLAGFLVSCVTTPDPRWALNLSKEEVPVMLTPVTKAGKTKSFDLRSGTQTDTATASSGYGRYQTTVTVSVDSGLGAPFDQQLKNLFLQEPAWIAVDDYALAYQYVYSIWITRETREFQLELKAAVEK